MVAVELGGSRATRTHRPDSDWDIGIYYRGSFDARLRDLDLVESWWDDARAGRFEIDNVEGHLAGLPTYVPVGEVTIARVLHGSLPAVFFPQALREVASGRWRWNAAFSLLFAEQYATTGDHTACAGMLATDACSAVAQMRTLLDPPRLDELDVHLPGDTT